MSLTKKIRTLANNSHGDVDAEAADADARLELVDAAAASDARLELVDAAAAADARLELVDADASDCLRLDGDAGDTSTCLLLTRLPSRRTMPGVLRSVRDTMVHRPTMLRPRDTM